MWVNLNTHGLCETTKYLIGGERKYRVKIQDNDK